MLAGQHDRAAHHRGVGHDVMAGHPGTAPIRLGQRRQDLHGGRLARTVGSEQCDHLSAGHLKGDVSQCGNRTERLADAFDIDTEFPDF